MFDRSQKIVLYCIPHPKHATEPILSFIPLWRCAWVGGHRFGRDMCRGLSCASLSPPERGGLGCGGGESKAAEGPGTSGGVVPLKASPWQCLSVLLLPVPCWEGPPVLCIRPRWHQLQPHPAAAAAGRQRPVQLPAAPAGQACQHHQSRETSVLSFCARWVTVGLDGQVTLDYNFSGFLKSYINYCSAVGPLFSSSFLCWWVSDLRLVQL